MEEPLPLVSLNEDTQKFEVHPEAYAKLASIEDPVYVVAIAGLYRTGKSFVLNQLAGRTDGFDIGSTIEPCTQGIWLWWADAGQVDVTEFGLPPNFQLVMLDTEGLGSFSKSETYDIQVFSLSLLLSSYFIYNSLGNIDETAIDRLSLVLELSKHIQAQTDSVTDPYQLKLFFPSFLWLVRDFSLELSVGGRQISSREYLENALLPTKGDPNRVGGKNAIRNAITQFFGDRDCYTMKRPVGDEEKLQNLRNLPLTDFRPEYLQQMKELKKLILSHVKPKTMYGDPLNGKMLAELMQSYVKAINEGGVPVIKTAWENVSAMQCQKALEDAKALYSKRMSAPIQEGKGLDTADFLKLHRESCWAAYGLFRRIAVGDEVAKYEEDFKEYVKEHFSIFYSQNASNSQAESEKLISGLAKHITEFINTSQLTSIDELKSQWENCATQYKEIASGPKKDQVIAEHVRSKLMDQARRVSRIMVTKTTEEGDTLVQQFKEQAQQKYAKLEGEYVGINAERKEVEATNKTLAAKKRATEERLTAADRDLREQRVGRDDAEQKLSSMNKSNANLEEEMQKLAQEIRSYDQNVDALKKAHATTKKEKEELEHQVHELQQRGKCSVM